MLKRIVAPAVVALATAGAVLIGAGVASAHHPTITAEAVCVDGSPVINYTSTAWEGTAGTPTNDPSRQNDQIDILLNNAKVDEGAYNAPDYSFSGTIPVEGSPGDVVELTAVAIASWGNGAGGGAWQTIFVTLPEEGCVFDMSTGRVTGGGFQVRVGEARVTRGLTVHCDRLLSNNLEVNWGGNKFHMTEHLTTVACTDDPAIIQDPPPAPLDTLVGVGTGRYNGVDGYTIEFTLQDHGEPGGDADQAALLIYNSTGVVLNIPLQPISGGNLQAHYDQPHS